MLGWQYNCHPNESLITPITPIAPVDSLNFPLLCEPSSENHHNIFDFLIGQRSAAWDAVPFFETAAAARGRGVLGGEDRVAAHRRLSAVFFRLGRGEAFCDEIAPMFQNDRQRFFGQIRPIFRTEAKSAAKGAFRER